MCLGSQRGSFGIISTGLSPLRESARRARIQYRAPRSRPGSKVHDLSGSGGRKRSRRACTSWWTQSTWMCSLSWLLPCFGLTAKPMAPLASGRSKASSTYRRASHAASQKIHVEGWRRAVSSRPVMGSAGTTSTSVKAPGALSTTCCVPPAERTSRQGKEVPSVFLTVMQLATTAPRASRPAPVTAMEGAGASALRLTAKQAAPQRAERPGWFTRSPVWLEWS
jgi:hypothetical protein